MGAGPLDKPAPIGNQISQPTARTWPSGTRPSGRPPSPELGAGPGWVRPLLIAEGMAAWMRGWRTCTPAPRVARPASAAAGPPPAEVVGVLAAMALACAPGG